MKKVYYTLALAALLTAGCSQNDELSVIEQPNVKENALTATFDGVTRTYTTDGRNTLWSDNDIIYVGGASSMGAFKLSSSGGSNTGVFLPQDGVSGELGDDFYAVYGPCTSSPTKDGNIVSGFTIPSEISYTDPNPNCKNVIMMGKVNKVNKTVSFKNTGAILYVKIGNGIDINKVKVVADYAISGDATVEWKVDNESHEEKPVYKITNNDKSGTSIIVNNVNPNSEDRFVVVPLPRSEKSNGSLQLQKIEVFVQKESETEKKIFTGSVQIERNKYYKIEYNSENDMIVNMEEGLISALNTTTAKKVTMVNNVTINETHELTTVNPQGVELNMGGKTLTIASDKKLNLTLGTETQQDTDPIYKISNGTIEAYDKAEINCTVNQPCIIELESCQFKTTGSGSRFTIKITIPSTTTSGLRGTDGTVLDEYIRLSYSGTTVNGDPTNYTTISFEKTRTEPINITKTVGGNTITLNIERQQ